ncbi:transcriptional regulator family: Fungal Specific TF [Penicillium roqueforti]|uniref:transcriptional regulator family: Fungal Specific TF n=1 Tax=Penicillium roqueforti TaxID=5082 RepID=UPI00190C3F83|nr:transcriptional regulator family: Fungal Specific TF [Penicillium roqueforti]KAF9253187.1 transcriptional regulator family: Fungal Specific TF [Penicillium roqueforti]KAI1838703.1 transcriptional regulator family: Fungal Specific TF [Penicillium roqueforti]KAI2680402.1 transcriptional regulator family: Fungal Specific TF [Penicillium roqueforti]KAI2691209.1 transcriptional regulator family: Fungal Specific TF [Penicillium roqueforti]KAI2706803.1 transcriptional regulator family: Fungal Spec
MPSDTAREKATIDSASCNAEQARYRSECRNSCSQNEDNDEASLYSGIVSNGSLFGASSGAHILHEVGNATRPKRGTENNRKERSRLSPKPLEKLPKLQKKEASREPSDTQFALPTRKVADNLMSLYWDYVDNIYPWLDKSSIQNAYETLWVKEGEISMNERALHCILNIMFAMSCVVSQAETPLSRYQSSVAFFQRAQGLMSYELMELYNFEIIQILLLTAVYFQHDKKPQKSFRSIGTAIHIAQDLGLHLPATVESIKNPHERDLARQVWNGCIIMDRIASMTFGCALKVPQAVAKQGLDTLVLQSMDTGNSTLPSNMNFYISFCRLHHIIGDVLETFYNSSDSKADPDLSRNLTGVNLSSPLSFDKFTSLFRIESELCNWTENLHSYFRMPLDLEDPTPTKHMKRQANILRARYLSVRLLLFRPFLSQMRHRKADNASGANLYSDDQTIGYVVFRCQIQCVKAAEDMIDFIIRNLPEQTQAYILPSNWYTVSYIYMATTILLAAQMSPQIVEHFSFVRLKGLLQQACKILKDYEKYDTLASRCSSVLKLIQEHIDMRGSGADYATGEGSQDEVDYDSTMIQGATMEGQEPQNNIGNLAWLENYPFDWNDWPLFFAQLDDETSPSERWGMQA